MAAVVESHAAQQARDQLADQLDRLSLALRHGQVPHWAVLACAPSIQMIAHVLVGPRGRAMTKEDK